MGDLVSPYRFVPLLIDPVFLPKTLIFCAFCKHLMVFWELGSVHLFTLPSLFATKPTVLHVWNLLFLHVWGWCLGSTIFNHVFTPFYPFFKPFSNSHFSPPACVGIIFIYYSAHIYKRLVFHVMAVSVLNVNCSGSEPLTYFQTVSNQVTCSGPEPMTYFQTVSNQVTCSGSEPLTYFQSQTRSLARDPSRWHIFRQSQTRSPARDPSRWHIFSLKPGHLLGTRAVDTFSDWESRSSSTSET
jgi:hypothetical protein